MLHAIVFSHRRQYQLHACLESLLHYVGPERTTVLYGDDNDYTDICREFPGVEFWRDGMDSNFSNTLHFLVKGSRCSLIMFCVDDLIFVRPASSVGTAEILAKDNQIIGFSLRLADHHRGAPLVHKWNWAHRKNYTDGFGWGYPFDLSGTIYRKEAVDAVMAYAGREHDPIQGPNHFEMIGYSCPALGRWPLMMRQKDCSVITAHVNAVQTFMDATREEKDRFSPEMLEKAYQRGERLNWRAIKNPRYPRMDTRARYWNLK